MAKKSKRPFAKKQKRSKKPFLAVAGVGALAVAAFRGFARGEQ